MGLIISLCKREKPGTMAYNCREAEQVYSQQLLKKPPKPIEKADICIVPVMRQEDAKQPEAEVEALPETIWTDCLGKTCHMTPTLYRTLRNQQNQISFVDRSERFALPAMPAQHRPFPALKTGNSCAQDVQPTGQKAYSVSWPKGPLSEIAPQCQGRLISKASPEDAHSRRHILKSLVRLSMAALAEQVPGGQLSIESAPVQQISQLLSLLHQGQVQPKPNHRGNKYTAKHVCCRNPHPDVEHLITKENNENRHHDLELLGEELGNLLDCPSGLGLDQQTEADPAWMSRLSIPLSVDYKDNVVSPSALLFPVSQETTNRDESHTFETFGKAKGCKLNTAEPRLASTFLSEMGTLFEIILAQNPRPETDSSLGFLQQVSICNKTQNLDRDALGAKSNRPLGHRIT
ncbi:protocadherin-12 [Anolis carolinensis]|uniref:protocadherin-12 n=1 Tax=Anolis carolinensis TaxID=28377 RepID=UPI002F2B703E